MMIRAFRVGAGAWIFTGAVHNVLEFAIPVDPQLSRAMAAAPVQLGPFLLDLESLNRGVSLAMGLAMIIVGLLLWMISVTFDGDHDRLRPYGTVALVASLLALAVAVILIPGPPLITFTIASAAFLIALAGRRVADRRQPTAA